MNWAKAMHGFNVGLTHRQDMAGIVSETELEQAMKQALRDIYRQQCWSLTVQFCIDNARVNPIFMKADCLEAIWQRLANGGDQ